MGAQYCAVAAKLKAMYSRFLTDADYDEMLSRKSVNDICSYLKSTEGYRDILADVNERDVHRGAMELMLARQAVDEYVRLYNFMDHKDRRVMEYWFMGHEVEFLKHEIRHIYLHDKRSDDEIDSGRFEAFFKTHTKINRDIMHSAKSLSDCADACRSTPYEEPIRRAESLGSDFFSMGMMLDSYYYSSVWRSISRELKGEGAELFKKLIGSKIDMFNLMWIYRGKRYFDFQNEIIFTYLLPVRYRIGEDTLKRLVNTDGADAFVKTARAETKYGDLFEDLENGHFPEENYRRVYNELSKSIFVNHGETAAAVYAYLNLREAELDNITTVTEGVRYNLNPVSIREHIGQG